MDDPGLVTGRATELYELVQEFEALRVEVTRLREDNAALLEFLRPKVIAKEQA